MESVPIFNLPSILRFTFDNLSSAFSEANVTSSPSFILKALTSVAGWSKTDFKLSILYISPPFNSIPAAYFPSVNSIYPRFEKVPASETPKVFKAFLISSVVNSLKSFFSDSDAAKKSVELISSLIVP